MPDFKAPSVEIGRTVLFHIDGDKGSEPCPGIVLVDAGANLTLAVVRGFASRIEIFDGVMHVDDPRIKNQYNDSGAWDYTAWDRKLMEYMDGAKSSLPKAGPPVKRGPGRPKKEPELESVGT
jgi:hypothetical protein